MVIGHERHPFRGIGLAPILSLSREGPCGLDAADGNIPSFRVLRIAGLVDRDAVVAVRQEDLGLLADGLDQGTHVFRHECLLVVLNDACSVSTERNETIFHNFSSFRFSDIQSDPHSYERDALGLTAV